MKSDVKCVKSARAPIGITPDACGHKLRANKGTYTKTYTKRITKLRKLETIVDPKPVKRCNKVFKNARAPIGIAPDACGHKHWAR